MNMLGRYEILSELGRGGMGVVYSGRDPKIDRPVAIKCLHPNPGGGDEDKKRFAKEMRALGRLIHQNIVTIFDADEDPVTGSAYIIMEYVEGRSLAQILSAGERLSIKQVREIGVQICMALDFAHEKGIVHRDMKPGNVLLSAENQAVKLVDFGIARLEEEGFTQTSSFLGTPRYMSPEQCNGDTVEKRSDLFSASAVLYELLTLRKAFAGDSPAAIIHQVVTHRPDPPMRIAGEVPKDLNDAIMKGLEKKPSDRFTSCKEMARAIANESGMGAGEESSPTLSLDLDETDDVKRRHVRRGVNKKTVALAVGTVFLLGILFAVLLKSRPVPETPPVSVSPISTKPPATSDSGSIDFLVDPSGAKSDALLKDSQSTRPTDKVKQQSVMETAIENKKPDIPEPTTEIVPSQATPNVLQTDAQEKEEGRVDALKAIKGQLNKLKAAYEDRNLTLLQRDTMISGEKAQSLRRRFDLYKTIQVSVSEPELDESGQSATAVLTLTTLMNEAGDAVIPGEKWKQTKLNILKVDNQWKIRW